MNAYYRIECIHFGFMLKADRQRAIIEIISTGDVTRQDELSSILLEKGYHVTQASISRDFEELGITKVAGRYSMPRKSFGDSAHEQITLTPAGENLIVAKCYPGLASAMAVRIDAAPIPEIIGTIAGDDTIFIAVPDAVAQRTVIKKILELT
jgi:transcriptional regulator of arginine metabolism